MPKKDRNLRVIDAKQFLSYDPETGDIKWVRHPSKRRKDGVCATHLNKVHGYLSVCFAYKVHQAHRIAWLLHYGDFPAGVIDHINGDMTDNRLSNLRAVTHAENMQNQRRAHKNNKVGFLGVGELRGKFRARINVNGRQVYLGAFDSPEEARDAYLEAKGRLHIQATG